MSQSRSGSEQVPDSEEEQEKKKLRFDGAELSFEMALALAADLRVLNRGKKTPSQTVCSPFPIGTVYTHNLNC